MFLWDCMRSLWGWQQGKKRSKFSKYSIDIKPLSAQIGRHKNIHKIPIRIIHKITTLLLHGLACPPRINLRLKNLPKNKIIYNLNILPDKPNPNIPTIEAIPSQMEPILKIDTIEYYIQVLVNYWSEDCWYCVWEVYQMYVLLWGKER